MSSFRRFGARCDDAHHCEQNGVVFEANFFAKVIEVRTSARSSFARPGPVDLKVRSVRRSDGSMEWWPRHRPSPRRRELSRATSSRWCSQTSIFSLQMHRPSPPQGACAKHSRVARNGTSNIACRATTGQASNPYAYRKLDHPNASCRSYTDFEWPIDALNRRNVLCACFSHAQTRPESLRTQKEKKARNGIRPTARATPGAPRTALLFLL